MDVRYQYQSKIRAVDFWLLSMRRTYHSLVGVCNIIFGIAMILLTLRFWSQADDVAQSLLFVACLLVPLVQPIGVYVKAKAQVAAVRQGTELVFADDGIHVSLGNEEDFVEWSRVKGVRKEAGMIIVFTDARHGYMLTNRVLGGEKDDFYDYVKAQIKGHAFISDSSQSAGR